MGAEVGLGESDRKGRVRGQVEFGVTLAPVFDNSDVDRSGRAGTVDLGHCLLRWVFEGGVTEGSLLGGVQWVFVYAGSRCDE